MAANSTTSTDSAKILSRNAIQIDAKKFQGLSLGTRPQLHSRHRVDRLRFSILLISSVAAVALLPYLGTADQNGEAATRHATEFVPGSYADAIENLSFEDGLADERITFLLGVYSSPDGVGRPEDFQELRDRVREKSSLVDSWLLVDVEKDKISIMLQQEEDLLGTISTTVDSVVFERPVDRLYVVRNLSDQAASRIRSILRLELERAMSSKPIENQSADGATLLALSVATPAGMKEWDTRYFVNVTNAPGLEKIVRIIGALYDVCLPNVRDEFSSRNDVFSLD